MYIKMDNKHIPKPILKWVGGKTQIIDKIIDNFPTEINNYHEIFLGGGSVLLALLSYVKKGIIKINGTVRAYDSNEALIYVYKNIQTHHNELYNILQLIITDFSYYNTNDEKEEYYYWIRGEYNKQCLIDKKSILCSAMFIFLNKTCFRGIYRIGPNGFNVSYGHYNNPEIINKKHLDEIHNLIQNVIFECSDFNISLQNITQQNDFIYLDPPYAPENNTSFVGYTQNGFNIECHNNLFKQLHILTDKNIKIMLSNSDVKIVRENFTDDKYNTTGFICKRSINSKNPDAKANEVIIKNY